MSKERQCYPMREGKTMSGKPNPTEILALLMNFQRANQLSDSIARRTKTIDTEQTARAALAAAEGK